MAGQLRGCNWCGRVRACQEAMGLAPSGAYVIAGWTCDPCRGHYQLAYIHDPSVKTDPAMIEVLAGGKIRTNL